jgi:hypothetical protein
MLALLNKLHEIRVKSITAITNPTKRRMLYHLKLAVQIANNSDISITEAIQEVAYGDKGNTQMNIYNDTWFNGLSQQASKYNIKINIKDSCWKEHYYNGCDPLTALRYHFIISKENTDDYSLSSRKN